MKADAIHHLINIFRKIEYILDGLHYINQFPLDSNYVDSHHHKDEEKSSLNLH